MTIAALITGAAQFIFFFNLFWSMFKGKKAVDNPWEATTLEWTVPSPPPFDNFGGRHPVVYRDPYEYGNVAGTKDYEMQTEPVTNKA
jgi:cytochrome c oxidase subunit 1